ncbi:MAG TPA: phosphate acetyltransferase [Candidatus Hydrogenedentes bacterium]|jgi:phosphate acetyltransferase|nr:phosphate acetyltransferase [Candidatus Hydrogenedentota bacterium]
MGFIDQVIERAQANPRTIVLPEADDERVLKAAGEIQARKIASVTLIGAVDTVTRKLNELGIKGEFEIVDPARAPWADEFANDFFAMRKHKGITEEQARATMQQCIPHGMMLLHKGKAQGLVAGASHSTGDTLRPALQILKTAPGARLASSFFFMAFEDATYLFADSGLVEDPNEEQLAEIAVATAQSALTFGIDPTVAMLSYSTKGSAKSPLTEKVVKATELAQKRALEVFGPDSKVRIDGELQGDAALSDRVGRSKAPGSEVAGRAKVLIFPNLDAGNIAYKLVQYLGGAEAYGPIIQGTRLPINDLSRGCSPEDIVGVAAITVVQSQVLQ